MEREVVLAGDSHLTPTSSRWRTRKLSPRLRDRGYRVTDAARGGLTSRAALALYDSFQPGVVVLSLGANDAAPWKQVPLPEFAANVRTLICRAEAAVIMTPAPVLEDWELGRTNALLRKYASVSEEVASAAGARIVPLFDRLLELMTLPVDVHVRDGLHLNDRAYDEMEQLVLEALR